MTKLGFLVTWVLVLLVGCADKAGPAYKECLDFESKGRIEAAIDACGRAVSLDPASRAGREAQAKQAQLGTRIIDDKMKAENEVAASAAQAAAAEVTSCKSQRWTTFCEVNGRPKGGLLKPSTLAKCQEDAKGFESLGMTCAPCKCAEDVEGAIVK